MTMNHKFLTAVGLLALGLSATPAVAQAHHDAAEGMEKCFGVAKKGMNDCASADGKHSCANAATEDSLKAEWVSTPKGLCDKLAGGSLTAPKAE